METASPPVKRQGAEEEAEAEPSANATSATTAAVELAPLLGVLSGECLRRALVCLPVSEIARSESICREWLRILRSDAAGRAVWRKAAIRSSSQAVVDALAATFADGSTDYRRIAICLAKGPPQTKPPPTPTLQPEHLSGIVHLERKSIGAEGQSEHRTVGVFTVADCSPLFDITSDEEIVILQSGDLDLAKGPLDFTFEGENPGTEESYYDDRVGEAFESGFEKIVDDFVVTLRLFRNQGGSLQSICVIKRQPFTHFYGGLGSLADQFEVCCTRYPRERGSPTGAVLATGTAQAAAALDAARRNNIDEKILAVKLCFAPVGFPPPNEAGWVGTRTRRIASRGTNRRVDWSDSDREEMSKISSFDFRLSEVVIYIDIVRRIVRRYNNIRNYPPISTNDMLLMFEGLAWE